MEKSSKKSSKKSSINIQPVKPSSEKHNTRQVDLDYVRKDLSDKNESVNLHQDSIPKRLKQRKEEIKKITGRAMQAKAAPIRDGVFLIKEDTTMEDCIGLANKISETFNIEVMQIHLHRDEGHYDETKKWKPNLHGHMIFDFMDNKTGKSIKLTRDQYSQLQTMVAEELGMERGKSSDKKHLNALQYKIEQKEELLQSKDHEIDTIKFELEKAKKEVQDLKEERERMLDQQIQELKDIRNVHEQEFELQRLKVQTIKNSYNKEISELRKIEGEINKIKTDAGNIFNELSQKNFTNATELNEAIRLHRALIDKKNESSKIYKTLAEKENKRKSKDFGIGD